MRYKEPTPLPAEKTETEKDTDPGKIPLDGLLFAHNKKGLFIFGPPLHLAALSAVLLNYLV
jgi:hypothetical protein